MFCRFLWFGSVSLENCLFLSLFSLELELGLENAEPKWFGCGITKEEGRKKDKRIITKNFLSYWGRRVDSGGCGQVSGFSAGEAFVYGLASPGCVVIIIITRAWWLSEEMGNE